MATSSGAKSNGSLVVVGLGMTGIPQATPESVACMRQADRLFYLATDALTEHWLRTLNDSATSLGDLYGFGKNRRTTYTEMTQAIVAAVLEGGNVCVAFYGHPGVFVHPSHWAIRTLRRKGVPARMLPGISTDACLYADLGINPGDGGMQSFEATDFLLSRRRFDPTSHLVLWQIGVLGEAGTRDPRRPCDPERLGYLTRMLRRRYPAGHRVVLYEAASFAGRRYRARRVRLDRLARAAISPLTTLYVPPLKSSRAPDQRVIGWLQRST